MSQRSKLCHSKHRIGAVVRSSPVWLLFLGTAVSGRAATIWCSEFESDDGLPVSHEQAADVVDNRAGTDGTPAGVGGVANPLIYVQYGQAGVPAIAQDPTGAAQSFCISTPDDPSMGINTNLPSNTGNLAAAVTFEGYFYTLESDAITSPSFVGRRLVSQKRSEDDGQSRLAVGLHADVIPATGLLDYEGFDYAGIELNDQAGGIGWGGPWLDGNGDFAILSDDDTSLDITGTFPFTPVGDRLSGFPAEDAEGVRAVSQPLSLAAEGDTWYLSYLIQKNVTTATTDEAVQVAFDNGGTTRVFRSGIDSEDRFFLALAGGSETAGTATVSAGTTYFVIVKIVTSAEGNDEAWLAFFQSSDTVPTTEAGITWEVNATGLSGSVLARLRLLLNANSDADFDEIRIGTTYESVTDPDAISTPGSFKNVLSVFWKEPSPIPEDPSAGADHLELGITQVLANTWYHFACVYDGTDIRWYLDGNLEGTVSNPDLIDPGPGRIAVGNNRTAGGNGTRGFFGLLDEVRVYEAALDPADLLVNPGGGGASGLLWQSRFETELGAPVAHAQIAASVPKAIDNTVGSPHGSMAGLVALEYASYTEPGVDAVPDTIDPAGLAGDFALFYPNISVTAIDTNIASNVGNLADAVTAQGYFNSYAADPVSGSFIGQRFVSLKRSDDDGQSRLAIGLHPYQPPPSDGLYDYDGFDYTGIAMDGLDGGLGWAGPYGDGDDDFGDKLTDDGVSLELPGTFPFTPVGSRVSGVGPGGTETGEVVRAISLPFNLADEGRTLYVSYLVQKNVLGASSRENVEVSFDTGSTTQPFRTGLGSNDQFFLAIEGGSTTYGSTVIDADTTYFVVARLLTSAAGDDVGQLAFFKAGDVVPTDEGSVTWEVNATGSSSSAIERMRLVLGANADGEFDEIRIGTTYESVTDPDAPLGAVPDAYNVVGVFYHDGASQLALGTTEILPNVWHHFALVYNGVDILWYLDGAPEGTLTPSVLTGPGTANITIGNGRGNGAGGRGFFGLLDKIVVEDVVRDPEEFLTMGIDACGLGCNLPFADIDGDGDVDMEDFSELQRCITTGTGGTVTEACICFDRDNSGAGDGDIDGDDIMLFEACDTGPDVPWSMDLTPGCVP